MAITTYTELKAAVADFLNRDDLTSAIGNFISLAEAQFKREIRHHKQMTRSEGEIDTRYSAVPADWLESIRFHVNDERSSEIQLISLAQMLKFRNESADRLGKPQYYAVVGESFEVYPTPDTTYSTELMYYKPIPVLSDSNASNWLLEDHQDLYLYGALLQSAPYLKDDARMQVWTVLYSTALNSINTESRRVRSAGSGLKLKIRSY